MRLPSGDHSKAENQLVPRPSRICRSLPPFTPMTPIVAPSALVKAIRVPSGDGTPSLPSGPIRLDAPPFRGITQTPVRCSLVPLAKSRELSANHASRSTSSPCGVLRGRVKPSLIRRTYVGPPNVPNASSSPFGDKAAAVTLFSLACIVICSKSGSLGANRCAVITHTTKPQTTHAAKPDSHNQRFTRRGVPLRPVSIIPVSRFPTSSADGRLLE